MYTRCHGFVSEFFLAWRSTSSSVNSLLVRVVGRERESAADSAKRRRRREKCIQLISHTHSVFCCSFSLSRRSELACSMTCPRNPREVLTRLVASPLLNKMSKSRVYKDVYRTIHPGVVDDDDVYLHTIKYSIRRHHQFAMGVPADVSTVCRSVSYIIEKKTFFFLIPSWNEKQK